MSKSNATSNSIEIAQFRYFKHRWVAVHPKEDRMHGSKGAFMAASFIHSALNLIISRVPMGA